MQPWCGELFLTCVPTVPWIVTCQWAPSRRTAATGFGVAIERRYDANVDPSSRPPSTTPLFQPFSEASPAGATVRRESGESLVLIYPMGYMRNGRRGFGKGIK